MTRSANGRADTVVRGRARVPGRATVGNVRVQVEADESGAVGVGKEGETLVRLTVGGAAAVGTAAGETVGDARAVSLVRALRRSSSADRAGGSKCRSVTAEGTLSVDTVCGRVSGNGDRDLASSVDTTSSRRGRGREGRTEEDTVRGVGVESARGRLLRRRGDYGGSRLAASATFAHGTFANGTFANGTFASGTFASGALRDVTIASGESLSNEVTTSDITLGSETSDGGRSVGSEKRSHAESNDEGSEAGSNGRHLEEVVVSRRNERGAMRED